MPRQFVCKVFVLGMLCTCNSYPRDQGGTSDRVQSTHLLRVGLTEHAPWLERSADGTPAGPEVQLVQQLAAATGARVEWRWG